MSGLEELEACNECKNYRMKLFEATSITGMEYESWIELMSGIRRKICEATDKYIDQALGQKNPAELIKYCKECYCDYMMLHATSIEQKHNHRIVLEELQDRKLK